MNVGHGLVQLRSSIDERPVVLLRMEACGEPDERRGGRQAQLGAYRYPGFRIGMKGTQIEAVRDHDHLVLGISHGGMEATGCFGATDDTSGESARQPRTGP